MSVYCGGNLHAGGGMPKFVVGGNWMNLVKMLY